MAKETKTKGVFESLRSINVEKYTEKRNRLTYLSWSHAWEELKKAYPNSTYEIKKFTNEVTGRTLPYLVDDDLGYLVFTSVTVEGETLEMWLPVMDSSNNAMKPFKYSYPVKEYQNGRWTGQYIEKDVQPATMFDVNKTIMRCLTKNIGMFGLGLNIYTGEDFPEEMQPPNEEPKTDEKQQPAKAKTPSKAEKKPEPAKAEKKEKPASTAPAEKKKLTSSQFENAKSFNKEQIKKVLDMYEMNDTQRKLLESKLK